MALGLPDIKMLDSGALSSLLEDNLSPPEITSIIVFATNGAIFAYASSLPARQLRNLSATYGAAYTAYAKNASSGNLTGVNPASHPSSYVTASSTSLGDIGSIVFELADSVSVVTRIADKVLLAAVGPTKLNRIRTEGKAANTAAESTQLPTDDQMQAPGARERCGAIYPETGEATSPHSDLPLSKTTDQHANGDSSSNAVLEISAQVDRNEDLARLASLNLSAPPTILLALESKSAALGRFLSQRLEDLKSPDGF